MNLRLSFIFLITGCFLVNSQSKFEELTDYFEDFAELSREQIYVHLNKSEYISNETIWFKSYIFSRNFNEISEHNSNLYCVLFNNKNEIIKQQMVMSKNGLGSGQFKTDSTFVSGEYTFRAYTNWSRNFENEYTHFETKIVVLNPNDKEISKPVYASDSIDFQVLPESGHFLVNIENRVGLIAKDSLGLGLANLKVKVFENDKKIDELQLNQFGIGSVDILPNPKSKYHLEYYYNNTKRELNFPIIEHKGITLNLKDSSSILAIQIKTNKETLKTLERDIYKLAIHNSVNINTYNFIFNDKETQSFNLNKSDLFPGMNIITLLNDKAEPIAERLYFNFTGLEIGHIGKPMTSLIKDSVLIKLPVKMVNQSQLQNFSISVLPSETKSYNHHSNIISSQLLQPYLKNPIQNAGYYFIDINEKKKKHLDELLLTEGWSRYDWHRIFNNPPSYNFDLETGLTYNLVPNTDESAVYFIYPNLNTKTDLLTLGSKESVKRIGFYPLENESLRIGRLTNRKRLEPSKLSVQFSPSIIPSFRSNFEPISSLNSYQGSNFGIDDISSSESHKIQELDEVFLTHKKEYTKIEKIQNRNIGKVHQFNKEKRKFYRTFAQFISSHGFYVEETPDVSGDSGIGYSIFRIYNHHRTSVNASQIPKIFLDDVPLFDYNILNNYSMENIDYVIINKSGIGEGLRAGSAGIIRIYNKPLKPDTNSIEKESFTEYNIPLKFSRPEKFYTPEYSSYETDFFKKYGVVDWKPDLKVKNGFIEFKFLKTSQPVKLFIEGFFNNKILCSTEITVPQIQQ